VTTFFEKNVFLGEPISAVVASAADIGSPNIQNLEIELKIKARSNS